MAEEVYSTNEQRIGTWIDGKPLYRIVVDTAGVKVIDELTNIYDIPSDHNLVFFNGYLKLSGSYDLQLIPYSNVISELVTSGTTLFIV